LLAVLSSIILLACGSETEVPQEDVAQEEEIAAEELSKEEVTMRETLSTENLLVVLTRYDIQKMKPDYGRLERDGYLLLFKDGSVYTAYDEYVPPGARDTFDISGKEVLYYIERYSKQWWERLDSWKYLGIYAPEKIEILRERIRELGNLEVESFTKLDEEYSRTNHEGCAGYFDLIDSYHDFLYSGKETGTFACDVFLEDDESNEPVCVFWCGSNQMEMKGKEATERLMEFLLEDRYFRYWVDIV